MGRGAEMDSGVKVACSMCGSLVYLATVIMVGCSFDTLDPLTAGIEFNSINKQIGSERAFTSGRYYLGLGREFLEFPMQHQLIEYSEAEGADEPPLTARSDNVQLTLEWCVPHPRARVATCARLTRAAVPARRLLVMQLAAVHAHA